MGRERYLFVREIREGDMDIYLFAEDVKEREGGGER